MSFIEMKEIYDKWTARKETNKIFYKIGVYVEDLLKTNNLGNFSFYIVNLYLFIYEFQKANEIFLNFNEKHTEIKDFHHNLLNIINYFSLESYFVYQYDSFWQISILFFISILQFLVFLFFITDYALTNINDTQKGIGNLRYFIFNIIQVIMNCLPYSLNYINLKLIIIFLINISDVYSDPLNLFTFLISVINLFGFSFVYICYCYLMNDVSPHENKYYPSTSQPFFNILTYLKFVFYNCFLIIFSFVPSYILYFLIISYYIFYSYYFYFKVYFLQRSYLCINISKNMFFLILFLSEFFLTFMDYNQIISNYHLSFIYFVIISLGLSCLFIPYIIKIRSNYVCRLNNYSENKKIHYYSDELYIYHLYSSREITISEMFKHKNLCKFGLLDEECICLNVKDKYIFNEEEIEEIKSVTCLILSKLSKNVGKYFLLHFNSLLRNNRISYSLFPFLLTFDFKHIQLSNVQFLIRIVKKFIHKYKEYYSSSGNFDNNKNKLNLETLNKLIVYEFSYRNFLKNIKKSFNYAKEFWKVVIDLPINFKNFMDYGLDLAKVTITISQDFGNMQKIHPHRIKLLKAYACFMNSVLNDNEYSEILVILIKEKLQMINNISHNINSTFLDKDSAIITISGESEKLFHILSYNKYAKNTLKISSFHTLKNMNMHYLQPFPFNIFHNNYIKYRFDLTLLSKERVIYCIEENGDLVYINVNALPCINFGGKINFFVTFFIDTSHKLSALVDVNGNIYAATKDFKSEFNISINCTMKKAIELFELTQHIIKKTGYEDYHCIDNIFRNVDSNSLLTFPKIFDVIQETKSFIIPKYITQKEFDKMVTSEDNSSNKFVQKNQNSKKLSRILINEQTDGSSTELKKYNEINHKNIQSHKRMSKVNYNLEKENSTIESFKNEDKQFDKKKGFKRFREDKLPTNNSIVLFRNNQKLEVFIENKTVLCGLFNYYYIYVKKSEMTSETILVPQNEEVQVVQENTFVNGSVHHGSLMDKGSITSSIYNMSGGVDRENKFKIGAFLTTFQNSEITINTMSKIFKKIFVYLMLIILAMSSVKIVQLVYNLYFKANVIQNFNILKSFFDIRLEFYYLLLNSRVLTLLRLNIIKNEYSIFKNRFDYLNRSFTYDIYNFESLLNSMMVTDLSAYPELNKLKSSPMINFTSLGYNYQLEHSTYDFFNGLNIYLSVIKENVKEGNFTLKEYENYLNYWQGKQIGLPSKNVKNTYFIFSNYISSFSTLFSNITTSAIQICNDTIIKADNNNYTFLILEIFIYFFVIILGFLLVRDIYFIHSFLKYFFSSINRQLVNDFLIHLKDSEKIIYNFKNDGENLEQVVQKIEKKDDDKENKNDKEKFSYENSAFKKEADGTYLDFNHNDHEISPNGTSLINKTNKSLLNSENVNTNMNKQSLFQKSNYLKEKNYKYRRNGMNNDQPPIENNNNLNKGVYFYYFIKGAFFFLSFFYNIIIQIVIGMFLINKVNDITYQNFLITNKAETELFLIDSLQHIIFNNHTEFEKNHKMDLFYYYSNLFEKYQFEFNNYGLLQANFIQEINNKTRTYYSENFCSYFHKETNNFLTINLSTNYTDCVSSVLNSGIQLYLYSLKNDLIAVYSSFNNNKNKTMSNLMELLGNDAFNFGLMVNGYYLRGFYKDLHLSIQNYFSYIILMDKYFSVIIFIIFLLQIIIVGYFIIYRNLENIYFYFEKIRILFSIIPKDLMKKKSELREFLDKYY
jgi:hypothetical protein